MNRPRAIRLAAVLMVFVALGFAANRLLAPEPVDDGVVAAAGGKATEGVPVTLAAVQRGRIERVVVLSGSVEPGRSVAVASRSGGTVRRVLVEKGDAVHLGQSLAVLDTRSLALEAAQAAAERDAAKARLEELVKGARPEEISQAEASRQKAVKQLETDRASLDRAVRLHAEGVVSDSFLEQAQTRNQESTVELRVAEDRVKILRDGATAEQLAGARAVLEGAQARFGLAERAIEDATVAAPVTGTVVERKVESGEYLAAGQPAFVLHQGGLKAVLAVPESEAPAMRVGQAALLRFPDGSEVRSSIARVAPALDPASRTLEVEVAVAGRSVSQLSGGFVRVTLVPEARESALVVPRDSVIGSEEGDYLFVLSGDRAARRAVRTGIRSDLSVEILEGLAEGEKVVVDGAGRVKDGSVLKVTER